MNRKLTVTAIVLAAGLSLTGCTVNIGDQDSDKDGMMGGNSMMGSDNDSSSADYSMQDIMFAQMMIPHHQQAVDMGTLAETRAQDPVVKKLAAQIKSEQAPEITQMKGWLKAAGASEDMGHSMGMNGMLDDVAMTALENATGSAFDKLYLEGMIKHHEGAISMAKMVTNSKNAEVAKLAKAIIASQTKQIDYMKQLLAK